MNVASSYRRRKTIKSSRLFFQRIVQVGAGVVLLGTALIATAAQDTKPGPVTSAAGTSASRTGNAETGKRLFLKDGCYECHGNEGQGANGLGPRLGPNPMSVRALTNYIRKPTGSMPPYGPTIVSDQDAADMHAYLAARPRPVSLDKIPTFNK
jgi:mono/diheme cytochrome c family protein